MDNKKISWPEIDTAKEKVKRDLKLSGQKVAERILDGSLPMTLWSLTNLTQLEISALPTLQRIPPEIKNLSALKDLTLSNTKIELLPAEFGELRELKNLILEKNQLRELPSSFSNLRSLQILNISQNRIGVLPQGFAQMTEIITINFSANAFVEFPPQLYQLHRLSTIVIRDNQISRIEDNIENLPNLHTIDLTNNKLEELPTSLGGCEKLKDVKLDGNPFKDKKFVRIVQEGKVKNILLHLKKNKPKKVVKVEVKPNRFILQPAEQPVLLYSLPTVQDVRPYVCCTIVHNLRFDEESYKKFIDLQTELHNSMCDKRNLATVGTHDLARIKGPFTYEGRAPKNILFTPLRSAKPCRGDELSKLFQDSSDSSMLKYLGMIKTSPLWPVLADSTKEVLSLPPVINGIYSQISMETTDMLLEVTSDHSIQICHEVMQAFVLQIFKLMHKTRNDEQLLLSQVKVVSDAGILKIIFPSQRDIVELDDLAWKELKE